MIDYVKLKLLNADLNNLLNSNKLNFIGDYSATTGEIQENKVVATIHYCKISIYRSGTVLFTGSIHKMYNSIKGIFAPNYNQIKKDSYKGFNGNQLTIDKIKFVTNYLSELLFCKPENMILKCVEFGLNLNTEFNPQLFLMGLLHYKGTAFEYRYKKRLWQIVKEDFRIKIYNKSEQYRMNKHTLRFEVNFSRMNTIQKNGIINMGNINTNSLNNIIDVLLNKLDLILHYDDTIREKELTKPQRKNLTKYKNVRYWLEDLQPNKRHSPKQMLNKIIDNNSDNLKAQIRNEIIKNRVTFTQSSKLKTLVTNTHSSIDVDATKTKQRICTVTGINISIQKKNSYVLSHTGLRYLLLHDKNKYDTIKKEYLTSYWNTSNLSKQITEIAHNIRNKKNNSRIKQKKLYHKKQIPLFNLSELIKNSQKGF